MERATLDEKERTLKCNLALNFKRSTRERGRRNRAERQGALSDGKETVGGMRCGRVHGLLKSGERG